MTSSPAELFTLRIETSSGSVYALPLVDIRKWPLEPQITHNPCLQVINDEYSILSVTWNVITRIAAINEAGEEKTIWTLSA